MRPKQVAAIVLCGLYVTALLGLFCFVIAGGLALLAVNGSLDGFDLMGAFRPPLTALTAIAGIVLGLFLLQDSNNLLDRNRDWFGPRPPEHPLPYAVMRLRRYALIPLGLAYVVLVVRWLGPAAVLGPDPAANRDNLTTFAAVLFALLTGLSRRPVEWTPFDMFRKVLTLGQYARDGWQGRS